MRLDRLKKILNEIPNTENLELKTEEVPSRGENSTTFEHHLVIFNKLTDKILLKLNPNRNQVYYSNGRGSISQS